MIPDDIREAINSIVAYNWQAEVEDYQENPNEGHILHRLVALDNFANGTSHKIDDVIREYGR